MKQNILVLSLSILLIGFNNIRGSRFIIYLGTSGLNQTIRWGLAQTYFQPDWTSLYLGEQDTKMSKNGH